MGIAADHRREQYGIEPPMGHMVQPAQGVGHGVAQTQPRLGKGHPGQCRRQMHLEPYRGVPREGGRKGRHGPGKGLPGK